MGSGSTRPTTGDDAVAGAGEIAVEIADDRDRRRDRARSPRGLAQRRRRRALRRSGRSCRRERRSGRHGRPDAACAGSAAPSPGFVGDHRHQHRGVAEAAIGEEARIEHLLATGRRSARRLGDRRRSAAAAQRSALRADRLAMIDGGHARHRNETGDCGRTVHIPVKRTARRLPRRRGLQTWSRAPQALATVMLLPRFAPVLPDMRGIGLLLSGTDNPYCAGMLHATIP